MVTRIEYKILGEHNGKIVLVGRGFTPFDCVMDSERIHQTICF